LFDLCVQRNDAADAAVATVVAAAARLDYSASYTASQNNQKQFSESVYKRQNFMNFV